MSTMLAFYEEIKEFARERFEEANTASQAIQFSFDGPKRYSKSAGEMLSGSAPYSIGYDPRFLKLSTSKGVGGWGVILSVDLRRSSQRADTIEPDDTYLTMHTYLPTMAEIAAKAEGKIGGLRGDGLFAIFGFTEYVKNQPKPDISPAVAKSAIQNATRCGKGMIEAVTEIINPLLDENRILSGLAIGVGICVGDVVVTQIGVADAVETHYLWHRSQ